MSLNLVQCKCFKDESCDEYSTIELFNWRTNMDEVFCMWAALEDCDEYRPLEETVNEL